MHHVAIDAAAQWPQGDSTDPSTQPGWETLEGEKGAAKGRAATAGVVGGWVLVERAGVASWAGVRGCRTYGGHQLQSANTTGRQKLLRNKSLKNNRGQAGHSSPALQGTMVKLHRAGWRGLMDGHGCQRLELCAA